MQGVQSRDFVLIELEKHSWVMPRALCLIRLVYCFQFSTIADLSHRATDSSFFLIADDLYGENDKPSLLFTHCAYPFPPSFVFTGDQR